MSDTADNRQEPVSSSTKTATSQPLYECSVGRILAMLIHVESIYEEFYLSLSYRFYTYDPRLASVLQLLSIAKQQHKNMLTAQQDKRCEKTQSEFSNIKLPEQINKPNLEYETFFVLDKDAAKSIFLAVLQVEQTIYYLYKSACEISGYGPTIKMLFDIMSELQNDNVDVIDEQLENIEIQHFCKNNTYH